MPEPREQATHDRWRVGDPWILEPRQRRQQAGGIVDLRQPPRRLLAQGHVGLCQQRHQVGGIHRARGEQPRRDHGGIWIAEIEPRAWILDDPQHRGDLVFALGPAAGEVGQRRAGRLVQVCTRGQDLHAKPGALGLILRGPRDDEPKRLNDAMADPPKRILEPGDQPRDRPLPCDRRQRARGCSPGSPAGVHGQQMRQPSLDLDVAIDLACDRATADLADARQGIMQGLEQPARRLVSRGWASVEATVRRPCEPLGDRDAQGAVGIAEQTITQGVEPDRVELYGVHGVAAQHGIGAQQLDQGLTTARLDPAPAPTPTMAGVGVSHDKWSSGGSRQASSQARADGARDPRIIRELAWRPVVEHPSMSHHEAPREVHVLGVGLTQVGL
ncbi:hypothetical protein DB30_00414 [Enhygromyxa salina]|uniref:Uncharacterized protein n=1 Tax=Enhygromyxa salina TaxID=215803 RepID=A0A0C2CPS6_9BACT|nr:hypothetical protein DB30_00414 [Enhygromyxa salina]